MEFETWLLLFGIFCCLLATVNLIYTSNALDLIISFVLYAVGAMFGMFWYCKWDIRLEKLYDN
jgi:energy-converting hydrogenase Eha subunit C